MRNFFEECLTAKDTMYIAFYDFDERDKIRILTDGNDGIPRTEQYEYWRISRLMEQDFNEFAYKHSFSKDDLEHMRHQLSESIFYMEIESDELKRNAWRICILVFGGMMLPLTYAVIEFGLILGMSAEMHLNVIFIILAICAFLAACISVLSPGYIRDMILKKSKMKAYKYAVELVKAYEEVGIEENNRDKDDHAVILTCQAPKSIPMLRSR